MKSFEPRDEEDDTADTGSGESSSRGSVLSRLTALTTVVSSNMESSRVAEEGLSEVIESGDN